MKVVGVLVDWIMRRKPPSPKIALAGKPRATMTKTLYLNDEICFKQTSSGQPFNVAINVIEIKDSLVTVETTPNSNIVIVDSYGIKIEGKKKLSVRNQLFFWTPGTNNKVMLTLLFVGKQLNESACKFSIDGDVTVKGATKSGGHTRTTYSCA